MKNESYSALFNFRLLKGLLSLGKKGYLVDTGWTKSYKNKEAIDEKGTAIPWLTYSFLDFLDGRLTSDIRVFEYGSGNSTLFFSKFVRDITSIEHDKGWYEKIKYALPQNTNLKYASLSENYNEAILNENGEFDFVLIDGRNRVTCAKNAVKKLSEKGVLILDDSERESYKEVHAFMKENGFKHIPFSGIAIGAIHHKCTSLFYRDNNVLDI